MRRFSPGFDLLASIAPRFLRGAWAGAIALAVGLAATAGAAMSTTRLYRSEAVLVFERGVQAGHRSRRRVVAWRHRPAPGDADLPAAPRITDPGDEALPAPARAARAGRGRRGDAPAHQGLEPRGIHLPRLVRRRLARSGQGRPHAIDHVGRRGGQQAPQSGRRGDAPLPRRRAQAGRRGPQAEGEGARRVPDQASPAGRRGRRGDDGRSDPRGRSRPPGLLRRRGGLARAPGGAAGREPGRGWRPARRRRPASMRPRCGFPSSWRPTRARRRSCRQRSGIWRTSRCT